MKVTSKVSPTTKRLCSWKSLLFGLNFFNLIYSYVKDQAGLPQAVRQVRQFGLHSLSWEVRWAVGCYITTHDEHAENRCCSGSLCTLGSGSKTGNHRPRWQHLRVCASCPARWCVLAKFHTGATSLGTVNQSDASALHVSAKGTIRGQELLHPELCTTTTGDSYVPFKAFIRHQTSCFCVT